MEGTNPIKVMEGVMAGLSSCPLRAGETWEDRVVAGVAATQSYRRHYTARGIVGHCCGVFAWSTQLPEETCPGVAAGQHPGPAAAGVQDWSSPPELSGPATLNSANPRFCAPSTGCISAAWCLLFILEGMLELEGTISNKQGSNEICTRPLQGRWPHCEGLGQ